ncbi:hypothetical protein SY88_17850 [Clostridiales bacterium PH28_bin88]|nr:hypothetical protein SY88_17850 [Clostridiales bacterium PH28_bin88]
MKAKITVKGQVTIPQKVRMALGVKAGDEIEFERTEKGYLIKKKIGPSPFSKYVGHLRSKAGKDTDVLIEDLRGR